MLDQIEYSKRTGFSVITASNEVAIDRNTLQRSTWTNQNEHIITHISLENNGRFSYSTSYKFYDCDAGVASSDGYNVNEFEVYVGRCTPAE
jgi:hypothetical protein